MSARLGFLCVSYMISSSFRSAGKVHVLYRMSNISLQSAASDISNAALVVVTRLVCRGTQSFILNVNTLSGLGSTAQGAHGLHARPN